MEFPQIILLLSSLVVFLSVIWHCFISKDKKHYSNKWPILISFQLIVENFDNLNGAITSFFHSFGDTLIFKDPIFTSINYLFTCDPQNIEYILKTNFSNFLKGPDFLEIVDVFGDSGLFTTDSYLELWPTRRKIYHSLLSSMQFRSYVAEVNKQEVEFALIPLLTHLSKENIVVDLQDVFLRLAYDNSFTMVFGVNPKLLTLSFPVNEYAEAIDVAMETVFYRHIVPSTCWKILRWLKVGWEGRNLKARKTIDQILENMISLNKKEMVKGVATRNLLSTCMKSQLEAGGHDYEEDEKALRDFACNVIFAASDTIASGLTWFFFLVSQNSTVEAKILEELDHLVSCGEKKNNHSKKLFNKAELKNLVYLHASLCEALRMYPPVYLNVKAAAKADVLPDGTSVTQGTKAILSIYATGRNKLVWGEDCLDYRPERWITEDDKLNSELMSKFFVFNGGPRSCIGRDMAFHSMKLVAANVLFNFDIQVVECNPNSLKPSMNLFMRNGLKVKITEKTTH